MPIVAQQKQAADALGISDRWLREWQKIEGFPDCSAGYDIEAIKRWQQEHERKGSATDEQSKKLSNAFKAQRLQREKIRTQREQLALEKEEATLLPRKAVEQSAAVILSSLADWCEQLPDLIAQICPNKRSAEKVRLRLKAELDARREQMADDLKSLGGSSS